MLFFYGYTQSVSLDKSTDKSDSIKTYHTIVSEGVP